MTNTIGEALGGRRNNFDAIRLTAALCVLLSHSYAMTDSPDKVSMRVIGELGVEVFFLLSGFLVTASLQKRPIDFFVISRLLRILPALFVVILTTVFILGPISTSLPLLEYFRRAETIYYLRNVTVFEARFILPGVFEHNVLPGIVNGSIWTLPVECMMYLSLPFFAMCGILSRSVIAPFAILIGISTIVVGQVGGATADSSVMVAKSVPLLSFLHLATYFLFGATFYLHRDRIHLSAGLAFVSIIIVLTAPHTKDKAWIEIPALTYFVLYIALAYPCTDWLDKHVGDISYGTYLWAFPVQQAICAIAGPSLGTWTLSALAIPIVTVLALASWHLVEKPALKLKSRFGSPDKHPEIIAADRRAA